MNISFLNYEFSGFVKFYFQYLGAVDIEPPVADEVLLVEQCTVGAQEAVLVQTLALVPTVQISICTFKFSIFIKREVYLPTTKLLLT